MVLFQECAVVRLGQVCPRPRAWDSAETWNSESRWESGSSAYGSLLYTRRWRLRHE